MKIYEVLMRGKKPLSKHKIFHDVKFFMGENDKETAIQFCKSNLDYDCTVIEVDEDGNEKVVYEIKQTSMEGL